MTLATGRLDRSYLKAYKELERIKAAREPQPDPDPPHATKEAPKENPPNKNKEDDENPANLDVFWVDPETGERLRVRPLARSPHGPSSAPTIVCLYPNHRRVAASCLSQPRALN